MYIRTAFAAILGVSLSLTATTSLCADDAADVAALTQQLTGTSAAKRAEAALAIGRHGKEAMTAVPALAKCVTDEDVNVRRAALRALRQIDPGPKVMIPLMAEVLGDADPAVAVAAIHNIADEGKQAVPGLTRAVADERTRFWATLALADIGADAAPAVPALIKAASDPKPEVRREVVLALAAIGPGAKAAVPTLRNTLAAGDPATHLAAIYALGRIGPAAKVAISDLKAIVTGDDPYGAVVAAGALASIQPDNAEVQKAAAKRVVTALRNNDPRVRQIAARALLDLPKRDGKNDLARAEFEKLLAEGPPETIVNALNAISMLGPAAVPGLTNALKHKSIRPAVASILGRIGPDAAPAVEALTKSLADSDATSRREILFALGRIGEGAVPAVPTIVAALADEDENVRYSAVYALGEIGLGAAAGTDALKSNLASDDAFYRTCSAWALAMVNPQGEDVAKLTVPLLVGTLKHERPFARIEAADALGRLGAGAASAVPALQAAAKDPDEHVRQAAAEALKKIGS